MTVRVSQFGHDISGAIGTNQTVLNADEGELFFDTGTNQLYVCTGLGVFMPVGSGGNVAAGAAGSSKALVKLLTAMADATFTDVCTVTVPNKITGAGLKITAMGVLGDGDSSQTALFHGSISRIAGAATGVTFGSATGAATNNGVTGNAALAIQASAIAGAVGATQTFTVQMKVTRSAGSAANHVLVASIELLNGFAAGVTVA